MPSLAATGGSQLELHPAWPRLTADQRRAVNEVWDEMVVPALEEVARMRERMNVARIEAQDQRDANRYLRRDLDTLRWTTRRGA